MKRKSILLLLLILFCSMALTAKSYFAIREDGKKVLLNDETMTWELEQSEPVDVSNISVPSEPTLYSYVLKDSSKELYDLYLENYEGIDVVNTINVLCLYLCSDTYAYGLDKSLVMKGIQYTYIYNRIIQLEDRFPFYDISNLFFFWEYAKLLEAEGNYEEALYWYQELERLYILTNETCNYKFIDNSLEEIQAKVLLMNLKSIN